MPHFKEGVDAAPEEGHQKASPSGSGCDTGADHCKREGMQKRGHTPIQDTEEIGKMGVKGETMEDMPGQIGALRRAVGEIDEGTDGQSGHADEELQQIHEANEVKNGK